MRENTRMKKVLSVLLCLCMVLSYVPNVAFAITLDDIYVDDSLAVAESQTVGNVSIDKTASLIIAEGVTLTVTGNLYIDSGKLDNFGTLIVHGTISLRSATINNQSGGTISFVSDFENPTGCTITNYESFSVGGDFQNKGTFTNSGGTITVGGTGYCSYDHIYNAFGKCMICGNTQSVNPPSGSYQISVEMQDGRKISLTVEATERLEDVKAKIQDLTQIAPDKQRLTFDGTVLEDGNTLQDYYIYENSTLELTVYESYNLWIGGAEVTSFNTSGEGWSYDQATNTLTLNGASVTSGSYAEASIYATDALDIVLAGSNTISGTNYGIYANSSVSISGSGSLSVAGHYDGIQAHGAVTINSGTVTFTGESSYGIKAEGNTLTFNGGYVTANGGASGSGVVANTIVLSKAAHVAVAHNSNAIAGTLNAESGICRTSASGKFTDTIDTSAAYFEFVGSEDMKYEYADEYKHTVSCVHSQFYEEDHIPNETGECTRPGCTGQYVAVVVNGDKTTYYTTVADALVRDAAGAVVTILTDCRLGWSEDISADAELVVPEGVTLTIPSNYVLYCNGTITGSGTIAGNVQNKLGVIDGCTFTGTVSNYEGGTIKNGTFGGLITNYGTIQGGTFNAKVESLEETEIRNGTFCGEVELYTDAVVSGGTFSGSVVSDAATISGGKFNCKLELIFGCSVVFADKLELGENFSFQNNSAETSTIHCTHIHTDFNTPANCTTGTICVFCGELENTIDEDAHSWGAWSQSNGRHIRTCILDPDHTESGTCTYTDGYCICGAENPLKDCDFVVTGDVANCSWNDSDKILTIIGGNVTVSNKDKNTATTHRIYIQGTANVTLDGVNISTNTGAPIEIRDNCDTNVTLTLSGSNTLISQADRKAAIHKTRGQQGISSDAATLTITGSGSLTAVGGNDAAGIGGGGYRGDTHNIIINGGTINAKGNGDAAGIGSSEDGSTWNIVINGGNITANGNPGIGANTTSSQGQQNAAITGGMVIANSYKGSTPTGGLVSTDGGMTYTVYGDYTLTQDLTIASNGKLTVEDGAELTVAGGATLTNEGILDNKGTISGNLDNEGTIYNKGTLPANVGGSVYEQYVKVNSGNGTGTYTEGSTVTITADAPASGKMFAGWTVELGEATLIDSSKAETTFTMPNGCVIVTANYADIVATVTDANNNVTNFSNLDEANNAWKANGGTLTLYTDSYNLHGTENTQENGVLDLNGHRAMATMWQPGDSITIKNGTLLVYINASIASDVEVTFENVTVKGYSYGSEPVEITNYGTIIDSGMTLDGVTINGGTVKTALKDSNIALTDIPTGGFVYSGIAQEPGVQCGDTALVKETDYTVTFSHSDGSSNPVNAGAVTMTITGIGNYTGTVTKTYIINKAALTVTAENKAVTYGDTAPQYTAIGSGFMNGETFADLDGSLAFACDYAQFSGKGTYTIVPSGVASDNYEITYASGTLTVNPKAITVTIANKTSVYGKAIAELTATDSGIVNNNTNVYSLATTATSTADVGSYAITGTALDANYAITFVNGTYTITQAVATVNTAPTANALTFNGAEQTLITAGTTNDGKMLYSLNEMGPYTEALPKASAAGTYKVWYTVDGDTNHTDGEIGYVEVVIAKADPGIGAVTAGVVNDTLETSAIVLTRANTSVAGNLIVDAGQTLVLGANTISYTFVPTDTNYKSVTGTVTVTVADTIAPTGTVSITTNKWTNFLNNITFDLFFKETQTVSVTADDNLSGVAKNEYIESSTAMDLEAVKAEDGWKLMENGSVSVTLEDTKQFIYYIRITDKSGNVTYLSSDGAEYDTTAPVIGGVANGATYYTSQAVTVTDKNLDTVTVNGAPVTGSITLEGDKEATYTIVATDKAGNSATVTVTMKPIRTLAEATSGLTHDNVTSEDAPALEALIEKLNELLADEDVSDDGERETLEQHKTIAESLLQTIKDNAAGQKAVTDKAAAYDEEALKSTDKAELEKLAEDIEALLDSDNLTQDERAALETVLEKVEGMIGTIEETAEDSKTATDAVDSFDPDTVTSADKAAIEKALADIEELLATDHLTDAERDALEDAKADAEALLDAIEEATKATNTENTDKVEDVTADNVTLDDKSDLEKAKADLEKALEDNSGNYTEEEKKAIEDELKRIDDALEVIENVEVVEDAVSDLPAAFEPDDEETVAKVEAAKKAYDELTDYEKSLVDPEIKEKLDKLTNGIAAYDIIKGDGSSWTQGTNGTISFTVNGPVSKFSGIKIDGKAVDAQHYEVKAGSTIITLKASYLETLAAGEHTITVVYTDGETSGTFKVQAKSTTPATGDDTNILLWTTMLFVSVVAMAVLVIGKKSFFYKAKYARK